MSRGRVNLAEMFLVPLRSLRNYNMNANIVAMNSVHASTPRLWTFPRVELFSSLGIVQTVNLCLVGRGEVFRLASAKKPKI